MANRCDSSRAGRRLFLAISLLTTLVVAGCSSAALPSTPSAVAGVPTPAPTPAPAPDPITAAATARYRATFQATWTAATHPDDFPSSAHFSPLVGGTHSGRIAFWLEGTLATLGIRNMAERGLTSTLSEEVSAAIGAGAAEHLIAGGGISSPAVTSVEFEVSQAFPLVTLVSMIAPTPDWFVGVSGLALFENNRWADERRVELIPWDAGTDSGATFTSPDLPTTPSLPIARIVTAPLSPNGRVTSLGTFTFTRLP